MKYKMSNLCRTCAKEHFELNVRHLFDNSNASKKLLHMFNALTGLELERLKYMPETMCAVCQFELEHAYEFRLLCMQVQKTLLQSTKTLEETKSRNNSKYNEAECSPQKHQKDGVNSAQRHFDKNTFGLKSTNLPDFFNKLLRIDVPFCENLDVFYGKLLNSNETADNTEDISTTITSEMDYMLTTTAEERKTIDKVKEGSETKPGSGTRVTRYICEQCGQRFAMRCAFEGHLNRHKGVNPYKCDLCPQKFNAWANLKRHKMKHAGIKPYPCRFCDRRFLDYYLRLNHERVHNNIRPFKCTYCDKAFLTNTILKNHILVAIYVSECF